MENILEILIMVNLAMFLIIICVCAIVAIKNKRDSHKYTMVMFERYLGINSQTYKSMSWEQSKNLCEECLKAKERCIEIHRRIEKEKGK